MGSWVHTGHHPFMQRNRKPGDCLPVAHMGYSSDSERPAKRLKSSEAYEYERLSDITFSPSGFSPSSNAAFQPADHTTNGIFTKAWSPPAPQSSFTSNETLDQPSSTESSPTEVPRDSFHHADNKAESNGDVDITFVDPTALAPLSSPAPSTESRGELFHKQSQFLLERSLASDGQSLANNISSPATIRSSNTSGTIFPSPFHDCKDRYAFFTLRPISRPQGGVVDGYVKFKWASGQGEVSQPLPALVRSGSATALALPSGRRNRPASRPYEADHPPSFEVDTPAHSWPTDQDATSLSRGELIPYNHRSPGSDMSMERSSPGYVSSQESIHLLPSQFGFGSEQLSPMERRSWDFYVRNWCPGRSILKNTNLWLTDFAQMQENSGVRSAIASLAAIYIYDYAPSSELRLEINRLFGKAEMRLTELINLETDLDEVQSNELVTIASVLSMQDIILTERRLKTPYHPRWLLGFLQAEACLKATDPGTRFWHTTNVQLSSLRTAQCILVGRAIVLAQPMMPLVDPRNLKPKEEITRFDWLLYGTEAEVYEIHGGCGFSKKLLHVFGQITYCAARIQQEPESPIMPMTAEFLLEELHTMRQWSREFGRPWSVAKEQTQWIEWIRGKQDYYFVHSDEAMTHVTAEAWRIAAIVYLQCRVFRLQRNHKDVCRNLEDLSLCIRLMPTSGPFFTAQAPLFPIFLLGMLATDSEQLDISRRWFESVVQTPVRSSVPPLFGTLKNIWAWMDRDLPVNDEPTPPSIIDREPWWEKLVAQVQKREKETLCLT